MRPITFTDDYVDAQGPFCWVGDRPHVTSGLITKWGWAPEVQAAIDNPWWNTINLDEANTQFLEWDAQTL